VVPLVVEKGEEMVTVTPVRGMPEFVLSTVTAWIALSTFTGTIPKFINDVGITTGRL
jgi:hypothetical protein